MPERLPRPPDWPQLSLPLPVGGLDLMAAEAAELTQPLSTQDPPELVARGDVDDADDGIFTAGVIALFVAAFITAFLAAALCVYAALLRPKRPADPQEGLKVQQHTVGGMVAGGMVGSCEAGDAASRAGAQLRRQLDLYGDGGLFTVKYELLGRDRCSRGSAPPTPLPTPLLFRSSGWTCPILSACSGEPSVRIHSALE